MNLFDFFFFLPLYPCSLFCVIKDGDVVSIILPPSQYSRTVTVTKGPQTTHHVCVTENLPFGPAITRLSQQLPTLSNTGTIIDSPARTTTSSLCNERSTRTPSPDIMETSILNSSATDVSSISLDALSLGSHVGGPENTPLLDHPPPPSHLREVPLCDRFHVSQEVQK